jgi:hypothetical protein
MAEAYAERREEMKTVQKRLEEGDARMQRIEESLSEIDTITPENDRKNIFCNRMKNITYVLEHTQL